MDSILADMTNPPKILMADKTTAIKAQISTILFSAKPAALIAPKMIIPDMALETLIKGE